MATLEEAVHRKNTQAFIDENPTSLVLERRNRVKTSAGGFVWQVVGDLPPQVGRIVMSGQRGDNKSMTTPDGKVVDIIATLIFPHGADVQLGDRFTYEARQWAVGAVAHVPHWRTSCEVGHA